MFYYFLLQSIRLTADNWACYKNLLPLQYIAYNPIALAIAAQHPAPQSPYRRHDKLLS